MYDSYKETMKNQKTRFNKRNIKITNNNNLKIINTTEKIDDISVNGINKLKCTDYNKFYVGKKKIVI